MVNGKAASWDTVGTVINSSLGTSNIVNEGSANNGNNHSGEVNGSAGTVPEDTNGKTEPVSTKGTRVDGSAISDDAPTERIFANTYTTVVDFHIRPQDSVVEFNLEEIFLGMLVAFTGVDPTMWFKSWNLGNANRIYSLETIPTTEVAMKEFVEDAHTAPIGPFGRFYGRTTITSNVEFLNFEGIRHSVHSFVIQGYLLNEVICCVHEQNRLVFSTKSSLMIHVFHFLSLLYTK